MHLVRQLKAILFDFFKNKGLRCRFDVDHNEVVLSKNQEINDALTKLSLGLESKTEETKWRKNIAKFKEFDAKLSFEGFDLEPDIIVQNPEQRDKHLLIEVQFRPGGEYKNFVEFEMDYKKKRTELGIFLTAVNYKNINKNYNGIPEFESCKNVLMEFKPTCPILLIGIDGKKVP